MPGDLTLHFDGDHTPVVVEATDNGDGTGDAPGYGDPVAIVGESRRGTHVSLPSAANEAIGILERALLQADGTGRYVPEENATYNANEVLGDSATITRKPVDYIPAGDFAGSAGDLVVVDTDGTATAFDPTEAGAAHTHPFGRVFTTLQRAEGTADKVGVLRH